MRERAEESSALQLHLEQALADDEQRKAAADGDHVAHPICAIQLATRKLEAAATR